jgi:hypothetical protein
MLQFGGTILQFSKRVVAYGFSIAQKKVALE